MNNEIKVHLEKDPILKKLIAVLPEPAFRQSYGIYKDLLRAIVGQQVSVKAASTIHGRFLELFEDREPSPEKLVAMSEQDLRSAGLSGRKLQYLQNVAQFFINENLSNEKLESQSNEELINYLTQIKGVGNWTVQVVLMFTLKRPDVFPINDLALQRSMVQLYGFEEKGKELEDKILTKAAEWSPYRTTASWYIWRNLDLKAPLD